MEVSLQMEDLFPYSLERNDLYIYFFLQSFWQISIRFGTGLIHAEVPHVNLTNRQNKEYLYTVITDESLS